MIYLRLCYYQVKRKLFSFFPNCPVAVTCGHSRHCCHHLLMAVLDHPAHISQLVYHWLSSLLRLGEKKMKSKTSSCCCRVKARWSPGEGRRSTCRHVPWGGAWPRRGRCVRLLFWLRCVFVCFDVRMWKSHGHTLIMKQHPVTSLRHLHNNSERRKWIIFDTHMDNNKHCFLTNLGHSTWTATSPHNL